MAAPRLVVIGSSNTDMIVNVPRLPAGGETVLGDEVVMVPGGKGANQAVAAARLGAQVHLVTRVGDDLFGEQSLANFRAAGLDTSFVTRDTDAASGVALIFVDGCGENAIAVASGANASLSPTEVDRAREAIAVAHAVVLQLEIPLASVLHAAAVAKSLGTRVILNPAPAAPLPAELLRNVDVLIPNEHEATQLVGAGTPAAQAQRLLECGVGAVVITLGAGGVYYRSAEGGGTIAAHPVDVVDTTAAGDCFTGALAVALGEGQPLAGAGACANAAAALAVTRRGAQPSLPVRAEVDRLLH